MAAAEKPQGKIHTLASLSMFHLSQPSLRKVDEPIHIGRRMKTIALQSAIGGMALSMAGMFLAATGHLPPVAGAVTQEIIDVAALLNALPAALPGKYLKSDEI